MINQETDMKAKVFLYVPQYDCHRKEIISVMALFLPLNIYNTPNLYIWLKKGKDPLLSCLI